MRNFTKQNTDLQILDQLRRDAKDYLNPTSGEFRCVMQVLEDQRLQIWTGSLNDKHHCGTGGLLKHVHEVWTFANSMGAANYHLGLPKLNRGVMFLGTMFHDYGKIWDYMPKYAEGSNEIVDWVESPHKRMIHHISRSNMEWVQMATLESIEPATIDQVSHIILSHHGCRAWGSPVAPATPEAWLVHLADMASAREDEILVGVDHLKHEKKDAGRA